MITDQEYKKLKEASLFRTQEDVNFFDEGVYLAVERHDPENLDQLLTLFDDDTDYPEVMYSLVHAIETYPDAVYVQGILNNIGNGLKNFQHWMIVLNYRILNDEKCLKFFKSLMKKSNKEDLLKLFDLIEKESEHHRGVIQELRQELES